MDGFELDLGLDRKFGLVQVNFSDSSRPRTVRDSAQTFLNIIENRGILRGTPAASQGKDGRQGALTTSAVDSDTSLPPATEQPTVASTEDITNGATTKLSTSNSRRISDAVTEDTMTWQTTLFPPITPGGNRPVRAAEDLPSRSSEDGAAQQQQQCRCGASSLSISAIMIFAIVLLFNLAQY